MLLHPLSPIARRGLVNEAAHVMPARDVQYNPKRQHMLVSCGDGCKIKFWDARSMVQPLLEFGGHTHWVWQARYNPFHDRLVLVRTRAADVLACPCFTPLLTPFICTTAELQQRHPGRAVVCGKRLQRGAAGPPRQPAGAAGVPGQPGEPV